MIIFSPTKTMKVGEKSNISKFSPKTLDLISEITKFSDEELGKKLKVKGETFNKVKGYYLKFNKEHFRAIDTYDGVSFTQITNKDSKFIDENVYIISALYGLINASDTICFYRLDFSYPGLYKYWEEDIVNKINEKNCEYILNLASNEYSKFLTKVEKKVLNVKFVSENKISTYHTKLLRGHILNYLIEHEIKDYYELINMQSEYITNVKLSDDTFMFGVII